MKRPKATTDSALLASIKQLSLILSDEGQVYDTHVIMRDNWMTASNQVISMGERIKEDLNCCPNALLLKEALSKCGQSISITQLEHKLSIKSEKFRALVPCIPPENLTRIEPDASMAQLDGRLAASLTALASLALDDENRIELASVLIQGGTITATDGHVMVQHWHGIDLPKLMLPKAIIDPVRKNTKQLKGFGYGRSSCTFHYEDDSWIKSQFFIKEWPDISPILDQKTNQLPLPNDFFNAVKALEKFSDNGDVYCDTNIMRSHPEEGQGASYEVYGLPKGPTFKIKQLKILEPFIKTIDFFVPHRGHNMTIFYGDGVRGAIAGRVG